MSGEKHSERAERLMDAAVERREEVAGDSASESLLAAEAQVHASLAIAEQLERLNDHLEKGAIEVMYGGETL